MSVQETTISDAVTEHARELVHTRLRAAIAEQHAADAEAPAGDDAFIDGLVAQVAGDPDDPVWRIALAQALSAERRISIPEALLDPALGGLDGAGDEPEAGPQPEAESAPADPAGNGTEHPAANGTGDAAGPGNEDGNGAEPDAALEPGAADGRADQDRTTRSNSRALRFAAVHAHGIETISPGDEDIELRLSDVGLDVLKPSTGAIIGRLGWDEIELIEVGRARRGLGGFRKLAQLQIATARGEATFDLPELTDEEISTYLEPVLERHTPKP